MALQSALPDKLVAALSVERRYCMHHRRAFLLAACLLVPSLTFAQAAIPPLPATPKHPVTDEYHGVKVTDDYRWLENGKDPAVIAWSEAQSAHTRAVLDALPLRTQIAEFLKALDNSAPPAFFGLQMQAGTIFALYVEPKKQQPMLVTLRSFDDLASKKIVLDPDADRLHQHHGDPVLRAFSGR